METNKRLEGERQTGAGKKAVVALLVLLVLVGLVLAANFLVGSVDILDFVKRLHGG